MSWPILPTGSAAACVSQRARVRFPWTFELYFALIAAAALAWPCSSRSELALASPIQ